MSDVKHMSVAVNYEGHGPQDKPGYVQFTRYGDRVYIVVDGRPVGNVSFEDFTIVTKITDQGA